MSEPNHPSRLHVYLVKPSKYDDEGYVVRHWRGVLPSNTLACLYALTEDVRRRALLGDVDLRVSVLDEAVQKIPLAKIAQIVGPGELAERPTLPSFLLLPSEHEVPPAQGSAPGSPPAPAMRSRSRYSATSSDVTP